MKPIKLKTAARIETLVSFASFLLTLPFGLVHVILRLILKPFLFILDWRAILVHRIGNKLFRLSDAVHDGKISRPTLIRNWTAKWAYRELERMGYNNPNLK